MRIESLTFLRFVAAIIVVIFHYGKKTYLGTIGRPFLISGPQMVTFFFVLSGFVMIVSRYNKTSESLWDFYLSRAARIVPVYFFALMLMVSLTSVDIIPLILSVTFSQAWISPYPLSINGPAWAISVQMFFYLTFPVIIFIIKSYDVKILPLMIFSLVVYFVTQVVLSILMGPAFYKGFPSFSHDLICYFPLSHYCSFLLGISGGVLYLRNIKLFNSNGLIQFAIFLAAILSTYYFLQNPNVLRRLIGHPLAYSSSFYALLFMILILGISCSKNIITRALSMPSFVFLGEISYCLYILQSPINIIYKRYISRHLGLGMDNDFYAFLVFLSLTSAVVFFILEKPCNLAILKLNRYISMQILKKHEPTPELAVA